MFGWRKELKNLEEENELVLILNMFCVDSLKSPFSIFKVSQRKMRGRLGKWLWGGKDPLQKGSTRKKHWKQSSKRILASLYDMVWDLVNIFVNIVWGGVMFLYFTWKCLSLRFPWINNIDRSIERLISRKIDYYKLSIYLFFWCKQIFVL